VALAIVSMSEHHEIQEYFITVC